MPAFEQEILPDPSVNLALSNDGLFVHGISTKRASAQLTGQGSVVGVKLTPAGFFPCSRVATRELVDRVVPATEALAPFLYADDLDADGTSEQIMRDLERMLRPALAEVCSDVERANALVAMVQRDHDMLRLR